MQSYLVTLDFDIAFAKCDETPGRIPPGTPEEIVANSNGTMTLVCLEQKGDNEKTRYYHCEMIIDAENDGEASHGPIDMFKHLPGFEFSAVNANPVKEPISTTATKEYAVVCRFRSVEAFFRLSHAFDKHISEGVLFPAPGKLGQYVAYVVMHSASSDGLEKGVEGLLRTAFEAHSPETADRFAEVTTKLL